MAKRAHVYPQVEPGAAALINVAVATAPRTARVGAMLTMARRRGLQAIRLGPTGWVLRDDLARASALGLATLPAATLARPLPSVEAGTSEITVRRHLAAGSALVVVHDRRGPIGAVAASQEVGAAPGPSLGRSIERLLGAEVRQTLAQAGRIAADRGERAFLVGGTVRDVLLGAGEIRRDLDIVVEGDGIAVARALAEGLGGAGEVRVVEHRRFLTASVSLADLGRIDVATARSERYDAPGALPRVMPATIGQDLARRDLTINAMAVELGSATFALLDPFGGRTAIGSRHVTVLHPLAFVEDPTRIFRAARYAVRLGFRLDGWTARAQALALQRGAYPALSGARLLAELELITEERTPEAVLVRLGAAGAFRLFHPRYRFTRLTATRLGALDDTLSWARQHGRRPSPVELTLLALVGDQRDEVAVATLRRLSLDGERLARLARAAREGAGRAEGRAAVRASEQARRLRRLSDTELAWAWLLAGPATRAVLDWFAGQGAHVQPELDGDDLIGLGAPRGPDIARLQEALRNARLDGALHDRDDEVAFVRQWLAGRAPEPTPTAEARAARVTREEG